MKGKLLISCLLLAFSLTVSAVNGQPFFNETNTTETESQPRTFTDCYSSFYSGMIFLKLSEERDIDSEPELKQFFTHTCNFIHDETGVWLDLWKIDELKMLYNQTDMNKFNTKYYPQGIPESVTDVFSGMAGAAGAVGNGTDTTTENEDDEGDVEDDEGDVEDDEGDN